MLRTAFATIPRNVRAIHASPAAYKTLTEKVSEVADTVGRGAKQALLLSAHTENEQVNKKVGQGLASAIETGEQATEATKEAVGEYTS